MLSKPKKKLSSLEQLKSHTEYSKYRHLYTPEQQITIEKELDEES